MILPATYSAALLLMLACLFCWGSWANTFKLAGRWRYELFYYDYALGIALCAVAAAFILGSLNTQDLTFQDNFLIASSHKIVYAFCAGVLLNIALICFLAAVSVASMSVAFPISFGLAVVISVIWNYFPSAQANPLLLFGGAVCLLIAALLTAFAHIFYVDSQEPPQPLRPDPRLVAPTRPPALKGVILAIMAGILMGILFPVVDNVRSGENGVSPCTGPRWSLGRISRAPGNSISGALSAASCGWPGLSVTWWRSARPR